MFYTAPGMCSRMGKVTTAFTMSLDGFVADANDGVGDIFGWYGSGDTEFAGHGVTHVKYAVTH